MKLRRLLYFSMLLLLTVLQGNAQHFPFKNYTTANGLIHNRVHNIAQDGEGYIWVGTQMGINRFDGQHFVNYQPPGYPYMATRGWVEHNGTIYYGVDGYGVAVCRGDSVRFIRADSLTSDLEGLLYVNDTTFIIISSREGICEMKGNTLKKIDVPPSCKGRNYVDLERDKYNNMWTAAADGAIFFPRGNFSEPIELNCFKGIFVNFIYFDKEGNTYVVCKKGVYAYTPADYGHMETAIPQLLIPPVFSKLWYTTLTTGADNDMWIASTFGGLFNYNFRTKQIRQYTVDNGLVSMNTWSVLLDREKNLWVTSENGMGKLSMPGYYSFNFDNSDYQSIKSMCIWNDTTMLFTNGISIYKAVNRNKTKLSNFADEPGYIRERLIKVGDDKLWITHNIMYDNGAFEERTEMYTLKGDRLSDPKPLIDMPGGPDRVFMQYGYISTGKEIWVITTKGLQLYKAGKFYTFHVPDQNGTEARLTAIAGSKGGDIWLADGFKNIIRCKPVPSATGDIPYTLQVAEYIDRSKIKCDHINSIFADSRGLLWVCDARDGMTVLRYNMAKRCTDTYKVPTEVFSSGKLVNVTEDMYHNLWIGTAAGLDKLTINGSGVSITKDIYNSELCGKYIFGTAILGKKLYIGTTGCMGVADLDYTERKDQPPVYISDIAIGGVSHKELLHKADVQLSSEENNITISFTGISFRDEGRIKYSYTLGNEGEKWSVPSTAYSVSYSSLPPGRYHFKVKAQSVTGQWSVNPASFNFIIAKPFYTSWWFLALIATVSVTLLYIFYRYRINQLLAIQRIRQKISKDLHDDIGATVSSINILANMAQSDLTTADKRNQFLETISEESRYVAEALSDIVWSINPNNDNLAIIFARMHRYASELLEAGGISYNIELPENAEETLIKMSSRQNLYLIFKEAVNNLVKYSDATDASITITVERNIMYMVVSDNGKGFDTDKAISGNGISNMKKRAVDLNGEISISSSLGKGTTVALKIPIS